jgi:hypothetical protein
VDKFEKKNAVISSVIYYGALIYVTRSCDSDENDGKMAVGHSHEGVSQTKADELGEV